MKKWRQKKYGTWLLGGLLLLLSVTLPFFLPALADKLRLKSYYGNEINEAAPDFRLISAAGQPVSLSALRGSYLYIFFGYASCNGSCPSAIATLQNLHLQLGDKVRYVFISIDNVRDNPQILKEHLLKYETPFLGLASGEDSTKELLRKFRGYSYDIESKLKTDPDYQFNHSSFIYLVDPRGQLRMIYPASLQDAARIALDFKMLTEKDRGI